VTEHFACRSQCF